MKFVIQRVKEAGVDIEGQTVGRIGRGYMVLLGACDTDDEDIARKMVKKMMGLRIFADAEGKTNLSLTDVDGEILIVSQFTLYADCKKGNRPSFVKAGDPGHAKEIYEFVLRLIEEEYKIKPESGEFGADMQVSLINDGPFTIVLDSEQICR